MDGIVAAVAGEIPGLIATHGLTLVFLLLSLGANVALYRDNKALNKQVNIEIKAGIEMAQGFEDTFKAMLDAVKDDRRRGRS